MRLHKIKVGSFIVVKNFLMQDEGSILLLVSKEECLEDNMEDYMSYTFLMSSNEIHKYNIGIDSNYDLNKHKFWTLF